MQQQEQRQEANVISDSDFILARSFDRQLAAGANHAQAIINEKNRRLVLADRRIEALEAELEAERARRRRAEFLLNRH